LNQPGIFFPSPDVSHVTKGGSSGFEAFFKVLGESFEFPFLSVELLKVFTSLDDDGWSGFCELSVA